MSMQLEVPFRKRGVVKALAATALFAVAVSSHARVTRIVVDATTSIQNNTFQQLTGRAFGELDPTDRHNGLITDINLAPRNSNGKVAYVASFVLRVPKDMTQASGVMWHDVPNRGGDVTFPADSFAANDMQLLSGWQGDNAGGTAVPADVTCPTPGCVSFQNHYVQTPVLAGVTGQVLGRIVNRSGAGAQPLLVQGNPMPYFPKDWTDNSHDTLTIHTSETVDGNVTVGGVVANSDWKYCGGGTFAAPLQVTVLPVQVCLRSGFDATKLYQLVYVAKDPYVIGVGNAAFRDVQSFFRYAHADDTGTLNPVAGKVTTAIERGVSQSGNVMRAWIALGMNEDEEGRIVHEGAWPIIAGRRVPNNSRWAQPDGVLELYQIGAEGTQWWHSFPDQLRNQHPSGLLDRCNVSNTCPKIIETNGGSEAYAVHLTVSWVGTDAKTDIPLPPNVRRYYLPSSTHGGGNGQMTQRPTQTASCPGNNYGNGNTIGQPRTVHCARQPHAACAA